MIKFIPIVLEEEVVLDGNATESNVLNGKTFYSNSLVKKTGTMVNRGTVSTNITTKAQQVTIAQGYHSGSGIVQISSTEQAKIIADNIKKDISILGVTGTYEGGGGGGQFPVDFICTFGEDYSPTKPQFLVTYAFNIITNSGGGEGHNTFYIYGENNPFTNFTLNISVTQSSSYINIEVEEYNQSTSSIIFTKTINYYTESYGSFSFIVQPKSTLTTPSNIYVPLVSNEGESLINYFSFSSSSVTSSNITINSGETQSILIGGDSKSLLILQDFRYDDDL